MRKKKTKVSIIFATVAVLVILACIAIIYLGQTKINEYKTQISDLEYELDSNTITVYVAKKDIQSGEKIIAKSMVDEEKITEDMINVYQQTIINGLPQDYFISEEQLGYKALINISADEPIMANAVATMEISSDQREYEISVCNLMTDQSEYDYIDVRILFPDGSDYIVLTKKPIMNLHLESSVFTTYCNEDEILRFSSAIIDAFTNTGTKIYTTRYIEDNIQPEATAFYPVRSATLSIMKTDPNILQVAKDTLNSEARASLQTRLALLSTEQLDAVASGLGIYDAAKGQIIQNRIDEEQENPELTDLDNSEATE